MRECLEMESMLLLADCAQGDSEWVEKFHFEIRFASSLCLWYCPTMYACVNRMTVLIALSEQNQYPLPVMVHLVKSSSKIASIMSSHFAQLRSFKILTCREAQIYPFIILVCDPWGWQLLLIFPLTDWFICITNCRRLQICQVRFSI